jgi:hypothetical protein
MKSIGAKNRDKNKGEKVCVWGGGGEGKVKKTNSQAEKGGKAIKIKHKKRKRVDTSTATFNSLLSNANSLVILQFFKSLFIDSSHVKFGFPLPLTITGLIYYLATNRCL